MTRPEDVLREFMDENADALAHAALSDLIAERDRLREALERIAKADTRYWQGLIAQTALSTQGDDE